MIKNILVTGGSGFIGSNFIRWVLQRNSVNIINLDKLTYAGNPENLSDIETASNYRFIQGDIQNKELVDHIVTEYNIDSIVNFAAESHVDRSILDSSPFYHTNVMGTLNLIDVAKNNGIYRYLQVSTDEVYGSLGDTGVFHETTPLSPNSPYSASKAAADQLVLSYVHTFGFPGLITRCSNNYGPRQFPEKLIPLIIHNAQKDIPIPVYGNGMNVRDWIHVEDHCSGVWAVLLGGQIGEVYNIGGESEKTNIDIVRTLLGILEKPDDLITYVKDRPGHDKRYAIDCNKMKNELNWKQKYTFDVGLQETVEWYLANPKWVENVANGAYKEYYKLQYKK